MNKIEKALDLIYNNNELKEKLIKLETLEEVYEFCASISGGYTREEFENFIAEMCKAAQGNFQEFGLPISDKDAEKISGGIQLKFVNNKSLASLLAMMTAASPMAYGVNAANLSSKHGEVGSEEAEEIEVDETDAESEEADAEENGANEEESEGTVEEPAEDDNDAENDDSKNTDEEKGAEKSGSENADTEEDNEQEVDKSSNHTSLKAGGIIATILGAIGIKKWCSRSNSKEPNKPKDQNLDQDKKKVEDEDQHKDQADNPVKKEDKKNETPNPEDKNDKKHKKTDDNNADNNKLEKPENNTPNSDGGGGSKQNEPESDAPKIKTGSNKENEQNKKDEEIPKFEEPNKPEDQNLDQKKVEDKSNTNVKNGRENVYLLGDNVTENLEQLRSKSHKSIYVHEKFPKEYTNLLNDRFMYSLPSIFGVGYNPNGTYDEKNIPQLIQEKLVIENKILSDFQSFYKDDNFYGTSDDRLSGYIQRFVGTRKGEIESLIRLSNMYPNNWKCFMWESCVILIVTCDILNEVFEKKLDFNAPAIKNKLNELNNLRKRFGLEKYYAKSIDKDGKIEIAEK